METALRLKKGQELLRALRPLAKKQSHVDEFRSGDTVNVHLKIREGDKERTQVFKGTVLKVQGAGSNKTFTVRKMSFGIGVERTFPLASPAIERVELLSTGKVRRSRLFYLRELSGRAANIESEIAISTSVAQEGVVAQGADEKAAAAAGKKADKKPAPKK